MPPAYRYEDDKHAWALCLVCPILPASICALHSVTAALVAAGATFVAVVWLVYYLTHPEVWPREDPPESSPRLKPATEELEAMYERNYKIGRALFLAFGSMSLTGLVWFVVDSSQKAGKSISFGMFSCGLILALCSVFLAGASHLSSKEASESEDCDSDA